MTKTVKNIISLEEELHNNLLSAYAPQPEKITCPRCTKSILSASENKIGSHVYQRVVGCDRCGHVLDFDAPDNWREKYKEGEYDTKK